MTAPLRPLNLGEILDRSFQIYRSRFFAFVLIAAIPALVMMAVELADGRSIHMGSGLHSSQRGEELVWDFLHSVVLYNISAFLSFLILPAFIRVASCAVLQETASVRSALKSLATGWKGFLWIAFLKLSAQVVIPEILTLGVFVGLAYVDYITGAFEGPEPVLAVVLTFGIPTIGGLALFLWSSSWLSLAIPAATLEGTPGVKALRRSWGLTKESRLRIMMAWLILATVAFGLLVGVLVLFRWAVASLFFQGQTLQMAGQPLYRVAVDFLQAVLSAFIGPIYPIALTLFYYDQRIRLEGYDIEKMMESAGMIVPATPSIPDAPTVSPVVEEAHS
jgi:hypothetical protein